MGCKGDFIAVKGQTLIQRPGLAPCRGGRLNSTPNARTPGAMKPWSNLRMVRDKRPASPTTPGKPGDLDEIRADRQTSSFRIRVSSTMAAGSALGVEARSKTSKTRPPRSLTGRFGQPGMGGRPPVGLEVNHLRGRSGSTQPLDPQRSSSESPRASWRSGRAARRSWSPSCLTSTKRARRGRSPELDSESRAPVARKPEAKRPSVGGDADRARARDRRGRGRPSPPLGRRPSPAAPRDCSAKGAPCGAPRKRLQLASIRGGTLRKQPLRRCGGARRIRRRSAPSGR